MKKRVISRFLIALIGQYEFRNLTPGSYTLALDPETLPPDYGLPPEIEWKMNVEPLRGFYLDIPIAAQRAVSGVVFIDKDGDGQFDPQKDEPVARARSSRKARSDYRARRRIHFAKSPRRESRVAN